ncbi:Cis-epoxysuccinate hydrolase [Beijerinckiaceae bacterium RH AL1]|nr:haloacid dehalogenase type II [Beijerinckiaceae bacterium]VVB49372.1 Cis-epoxysuccinate hydrolase [Beijerinckiaceae bacterium RH CH11]VVB49452.1 Cis-epoxysuccinate hydrolase [Beijerinckiaceae bacterium RH AL8]VVC56869.1 Cis-epoxysuccinate hydrolase [Beijerinckiaceae bacterium RH AL1]
MTTTSSTEGAAHGAFSKIDPAQIKALAFDMQGTLLDFYSTIVEMGSPFTTARGIEVDWTRLLEDWRKGYRQQLDSVTSGAVAWRSTDQIYRETLDRLLEDHAWGVSISADERQALSAAWSRLKPWPDTRPGLERLRDRFTLATLSNGSMASVVNIVKTHDLPFHCVLTAELVKSSKPDPKVYDLALRSLGVKPQEIVMVACHKYDLVAAKALGFRVAFIPRPLELGSGAKVDLRPEDYFDAMVPSMTELADVLGT